MTFDKNALNALLAQDDRTLWKSIRMIASANGLRLSDVTPSEQEMARLRAALGGKNEVDVSGAIKTVNEFKKKYR